MSLILVILRLWPKPWTTTFWPLGSAFGEKNCLMMILWPNLLGAGLESRDDLPALEMVSQSGCLQHYNAQLSLPVSAPSSLL